MKYRALTSNGDYSFGNNSFDYKQDLEAVAQAVKTKILLFYGEWWEDISLGIPMFENIIGQINTENIRSAASLLIKKRILETPGVYEVYEIQTDVDRRNRTLHVVARIKTYYGATEIEVMI